MKSVFAQNFYQKIILVMQKEGNYQNVMAVPKLKKIIVSMSIKQVLQDKKNLNEGMHEMFLITGQKPVITKARKSIAGFKLRKGMPLGCKVTLRRDKMYDFFYRLVSIVLPRIRDFRGFSKKAFDLQGNYNIGIKEEIVFPEIDYDKIKFNKGMNITFVTTTKDSQESLFLLKSLGFPVKK